MKSMKHKLLFCLLFFLFQCANTSYYQTWGKQKVRLNGYTVEEGYQKIQSFNFSYTRVYLFWGLSNVRDQSLDEFLSEYYLKYPHTHIGDLKITEEYEFMDGVYDMITFGIVRPYTVHIRGNLYSQNKGNNR
ncbi:hypothetical protein EHQ92_16175 [Leptospira biflexa]|nr:hypothetical protein EHQ92_16175 [Leptospira biflexa]TGM45941.1 hypothetical protein EHQ88_13895 [Leptospira biflexa]TGM51649.1 hypothetical protein EHQ91_16685 [Leptospira biflexa]